MKPELLGAGENERRILISSGAANEEFESQVLIKFDEQQLMQQH